MRGPDTNPDADELALRALVWTLAEPARAGRLLDLTGLPPADLKARAGAIDLGACGRPCPTAARAFRTAAAGGRPRAAGSAARPQSRAVQPLASPLLPRHPFRPG